MNTKTYYVICVNKQKVLGFMQEGEKFISVIEFNDISFSNFFMSLEAAKETLKEITKQKGSEWEYSLYYNPEKLSIVKVEMKYGIIKEDVT